MGSAFIQGLQGDDPNYLKLVATSKHFVANNEENRRNDGSADVDEISLREYYLPAFEQSIREGGSTSVMSAYNALNGTPCTASSFLLNDLLREEWGFDGVVMSDGSAVAKIFTHHHFASTPAKGAAMALLAGCDMSLRDEYRDGLREAYVQQLITDTDIDRALARVLTLRERLGMFDPDTKVSYSQIPESVIECEAHQQLALEAARKSIILFKNDSSLLPLKKEKKQKIALIGEAFHVNYYGDYSGMPQHESTLYKEINERAGNCEFIWISEMKGAGLVPSSAFRRSEKYADVGVVGLTGEYFSSSDLSGKPFLERNDHTINHKLNKDTGIASKFKTAHSIRWTSNIVSDKSGMHTFTFEGMGSVRIKISGKEIPFDQSTGVFSYILTQGKPIPFSIEFTNISDDSPVSLMWEQPREENSLTPAKLAESCDAAIIFIRDDGGAEGRDRDSLSLSSLHSELIKEISRVNKNTILILGSSTPLILTSVVPQVGALLNSWIAGQRESEALSEILFGEVNPSGKSPVTFFTDESQLPAIDSYDVRSGRSYQYFKGDVLFPFGYGLSYTTFHYGQPEIAKKVINPNDEIKVSVEISNTGEYDGEEVVQCYATNARWQMSGLQKKLISFKRVSIPKGQKKRVEFTIPAKELSRWNTQKQCWEVEPGRYALHVVRNSKENNYVECQVE